MLWNYSQLKEALTIRNNPFLKVFEQYCQDMRSNTRVLEWSCKITKEYFEGARFLHTARFKDFSKAQHAVERLYSFLCAEIALQELQQNLFYWLRPLAHKIGEGVALGYAEQGTTHERHAEIKLYVTTSQIEAVTSIIEFLVPKGAMPPENTSRVMIAASIDDQKVYGYRIYYLWEQDKIKYPTVFYWLNKWCTPEEIHLMNTSNSRTISIAFKQGKRDMIYLSSPFNKDDLNCSARKVLKSYPIAYSQLDNIRWIGFSKWGEGLKMKEMNVYFNSTFL